MKLQYIGKVGVDGGSIIINDPCVSNLLQDFDWQVRGVSKEMDFPSAVMVHTGDGDYPVYLVYEKELSEAHGIFIWIDKNEEGESILPDLVIERKITHE